jgi:hypothetical protein
MGGNSAMRDTETILPLIKELAASAKVEGPVPEPLIVEKLRQYEGEMIPRAFTWVEKSGGTSVVVREDELSIDRRFADVVPAHRHQQMVLPGLAILCRASYASCICLLQHLHPGN